MNDIPADMTMDEIAQEIQWGNTHPGKVWLLKTVVSYVGVYFIGEGARKYWQITCPCGVAVEYPVNGLPVVDTPHPCGHADHWSVRYADDAAVPPAPTT